MTSVDERTIYAKLEAMKDVRYVLFMILFNFCKYLY